MDSKPHRLLEYPQARMPLAVYSLGLLLVLVLGLPWWLFRLLTSGKYREGLLARMGRVPRHLRPDRPVVWVHAVSVGELISASRLIRQMDSRFPELRIFVSTTTRTGQKLARERFGPNRVFYFPLDFAWIVRRYLARLRPVLLVLLETEFWPNVLSEFARAQIPMAVVNARISDRSFPRYRALRRLWKPLLSRIQVFLAQTAEDAARLRVIGAPADRVRVMGNLKFDVTSAGEPPITAALRARLPRGERVLVCGSTAAGEEELLLDAFSALLPAHPNLLMILAPRHPERFDPVAALVERRGLALVRRSRWMKQPTLLAAGSVVLLDSIGELDSVYSLASVAFVGGSLVPSGGHNPLEPAQFGVPIVMGSHYENFRGIVEAMIEGDALKLTAKDVVRETLDYLLREREEADLMGARALGFFDSQAGATDRALREIAKLLPESYAAARPSVKDRA